jgi:hypothetical protein
VVKFWQKRACNYANPFMRENTRGYRRKTVNLHVELVSDDWFGRGHDHNGGTYDTNGYWRVKTLPGTFV